MTRDEKIARAVELRGQDVRLGEIAIYLGVGRTTIRRWTDPDYADWDRKWRRERGTASCPNCGATYWTHNAACAGCRNATSEVRRTLVEGMWADGWVRSEINAVLGLSSKSGFIFVRRAQAGWDLPHRRSPEALANIRAGNPRLA